MKQKRAHLASDFQALDCNFLDQLAYLTLAHSLRTILSHTDFSSSVFKDCRVLLHKRVDKDIEDIILGQRDNSECVECGVNVFG